MDEGMNILLGKLKTPALRFVNVFVFVNRLFSIVFLLCYFCIFIPFVSLYYYTFLYSLFILVTCNYGSF